MTPASELRLLLLGVLIGLASGCYLLSECPPLSLEDVPVGTYALSSHAAENVGRVTVSDDQVRVELDGPDGTVDATYDRVGLDFY